MSDSEHRFDEELISAYLDGELSDAERAQVEQALSDDARCRQTWHDLQAIRASLQSLPTHQTGPDFRNTVLRRIETVLREKQDGPSNVADHQTVQATGPETTVSRPMRNWRGTIWAFGTVAAAAVLLVMLLLPDPPNVADLAQNDPAGDTTAEQTSDGVSRAKLASQVQPSQETSRGSFTRKAEEFNVDSQVAADDALGLAGSDVFQSEPAEIDVASSSRAPEKAVHTAPQPTNETRQQMSPMEEPPPAPTATSPRSRHQPAKKLAGVAQEALWRIAADRPSAESMASAMQQNDPKYLVHVIVNRSDTGGQAFDRSLANNEIQYQKQTELSGLALRSLGRLNAERRSGPVENEREELASQLQKNHATHATARPEAPQLVIVEATATRLRDTVNELIRDRHEFQKVEIYKVVSNGDATVELKTGDNLWRFRRALPFELEQKGLEMAADESELAKGARKADLNLPEALDSDALDAIEQPDQAGAAGRSAPRPDRSRGLDADDDGRRLDSQPVRTRSGIAVRQLTEPNRGAETGGFDGANHALSDQSAAPPVNQPSLGLTDPTSAKVFGERGRRGQGSMQVLFVLSPFSATPAPSITAAEPVAREVSPVQPVAEPDENR